MPRRRRRRNPLAYPDVGDVCPRYAYSRWGAPIPEDRDRTRKRGRFLVVARDRYGREVRGRHVGATAPVRPSAGALLRRPKSLCDRGMLFDVDGARVAARRSKIGSLNRAKQALDLGWRLAPEYVPEIIAEADRALDRMDVIAADEARQSSLPYPVRAGSTPCAPSAEWTPRRVVEALATWAEGEGYESATEGDFLHYAARAIPKSARAKLTPRLRTVEDIPRVMVEAERVCLEVWRQWYARHLEGRKRAMGRTARELRTMYPKKAKR